MESKEIISIAAINFLSKEGKELLPKDLLQEDRSLGFERRDEYYFKRSTDDSIYKHLLGQGGGILLNSLPLNGKTTTVYKLLKNRFPDYQVHIADGWKLSVESKIWDEGLDLLKGNIEKIGGTFENNIFIFDDVIQYLGLDDE